MVFFSMLKYLRRYVRVFFMVCNVPVEVAVELITYLIALYRPILQLLPFDWV